MNDRIEPRREGDALLSWLSLFGWSVELDQDGDTVTGVASRMVGEGAEMVLRARAADRTEVVWKLFQRALATLETASEAETPSAPVYLRFAAVA